MHICMYMCVCVCMCVYVCVHVHIHRMCVWVLTKSRRGIASPEVGVAGVCELELLVFVGGVSGVWEWRFCW